MKITKEDVEKVKNAIIESIVNDIVGESKPNSDQRIKSLSNKVDSLLNENEELRERIDRLLKKLKEAEDTISNLRMKDDFGPKWPTKWPDMFPGQPTLYRHEPLPTGPTCTIGTLIASQLNETK